MSSVFSPITSQGIAVNLLIRPIERSEVHASLAGCYEHGPIILVVAHRAARFGVTKRINTPPAPQAIDEVENVISMDAFITVFMPGQHSRRAPLGKRPLHFHIVAVFAAGAVRSMVQADQFPWRA